MTFKKTRTIGTNIYLSFNRYIKKFKGAAPRVNVGVNKTIDINGSFDQWNDVTAVYRDFVNDTVERNARGFGKLRYFDDSGRNGFDVLKVSKDDNNVYFYIKTVEDITPSSDSNWMTLFISNGESQSWYSYNYVVNRVSPTNSEAVIEKAIGGWSFEEVGRAKMNG